MAAVNIFNYAAETPSTTIKNTDPTVLRSGASVALEGTGALVLASAGVLSTNAALDGTGTLVLASSGVLIADASLEGTGALVLASAGVLVTNAALLGAATLVLDSTGDLLVSNEYLFYYHGNRKQIGRTPNRNHRRGRHAH